MKISFQKAAAAALCAVISCTLLSEGAVYADDIQIVTENEAEQPDGNIYQPEETEYPSEIEITQGESKEIEINGIEENQKDGLIFESSNPEAAEISDSGVIKANMAGMAVITVHTAESAEPIAQYNVIVRLRAPEEIRISGNENNSDVEISWSGAENAEKYNIYRMQKGSEWKKISSTSYTSYTDNAISGGKTYSYRVKAVSSQSKCSSTYSEVQTVKTPNKPYGMMISNVTNSGIEYYWKKPENVDGYIIYRSYSKNGTYSKIAVIDDPTCGTYIDKTFNHSYNYVYYKIRSYSNASGGRLYSGYTSSTCAQYRSSLKLSNKKLYVRSNESRRLSAYYGWGDASSLKWTSSNNSIASVSSNGKITGVSAGTCTIRCYSPKIGVSKSCTVIVDRKPFAMLKSTVALKTRYYEKSEGYWVKKDANKQDSAVIMMAGDMMCTGAQQGVQGYSTGDYNFNGSFSKIADTIRSADLAIGNLETTLSSSWPYMHDEGYIENKPNCNAPSRYLDAVRYAGFDGVVMANNHNCDAGIQGLKDTLEQVNRYSLAHTGTFNSGSNPRYMIFDVNGIKIGFVSYVSETTGYNGKDKNWSQKQKDIYLNYYTTEKAEKDLAEMRQAGAEYCIPFMHWGIKNAQSVKESQRQAAQELADMGYDYIVGSHPHLIQQYTTIVAQDGREVPCFYSLGDFQSSVDQIAGNRDTAILRIKLERKQDGSIVLSENNYIPCYIYTKLNGEYYVTTRLRKSMSDYAVINKRIKKAVGGKITEY